MVGLSAYICDQTLRTVIMMLSSVHRRWWQDHHGYDHDSRQEQDLAERRQMGDGVFLAVADLSCVWMWGWLVSCPCLYIEAVGGWSKLGRKLSPHHYFILQLLLQEIKLSPFNSPIAAIFFVAVICQNLWFFLPFGFICLSCHWPLAAIYLVLGMFQIILFYLF